MCLLELKILSEFKLNKAGLRIAYSNQQEYREMGDCQRLFITKKAWLLNGWVDGWMGGLKLNYNGGPFSKMV